MRPRATARSEVRVGGFGIALRLPREHEAPAPREFIGGTLSLYGSGTDRADEPLDPIPGAISTARFCEWDHLLGSARTE
jgi:hypothetical protein